jgi:hypothetical protein
MRTQHRIACVAAVLALAATAHADAQTIYRCETGGVVTFADRPCAEDAVAHTPDGRLSVVTPAGNLEQVAESNRAFIEQRRARLAAQRARAAQQATPARAERAAPSPDAPTIPWWPAYRDAPAPRSEPQTPDRRAREQQRSPADPGRGVIERRRALLPRGRDRRRLVDDGYQ